MRGNIGLFSVRLAVLLGVILSVSCAPERVQVMFSGSDSTGVQGSGGLRLARSHRVRGDSLFINFYQGKDSLRATIVLVDSGLARMFRQQQAQQDTFRVNFSDEKIPGSLLITSNGFAFTLLDPKNRGRLVIKLAEQGATFSVYDSLGRLIYGE
ncbi:MAG: hypothetical protein ABIK11_07435 [candidate division WOR-3 bacterium]